MLFPLHLDSHARNSRNRSPMPLRCSGSQALIRFCKFREPLVKRSQANAQNLRGSHPIVIGVLQCEPDISFFHFLQRPAGLKSEAAAVMRQAPPATALRATFRGR